MLYSALMHATESNLRSQCRGISQPLPYSVLRASYREGISIYKERGCSSYLLRAKKMVLEPGSSWCSASNVQQQELPGGRRGGTPYNGLYVGAPPERGTFFRLQVHKRVGTLKQV